MTKIERSPRDDHALGALSLSCARRVYEQPRPRVKSAEGKRGDGQRDALFARREAIVRAGRNNPALRLASLLIVLAHRGQYEGLGRFVIAHTINCAFVAEQLAVSVDDLERLLLRFQEAGLVKPLSSGQLQIVDFGALEQLSDVPETASHFARDGIAAGGVIGSALGRRDRPPPRCFAPRCNEPPLAKLEEDRFYEMAAIALFACLSAAFAITYGVVGL